MTKRSRIILLGMFITLGLSALGLILGMLYDLYVIFVRHAQLENVLANNIAYYKTVGGLGVIGMVLFFAFLISAMVEKKQGKSR
jgi:ABC-type amino acid transport system permease subunit